MTLGSIPLGSIVHNVELTLGKGGQIARAAGGVEAAHLCTDQAQ